MVMEPKRRGEIRRALLDASKRKFGELQQQKSSSSTEISCLAPISPTPYSIIQQILPQLHLKSDSTVLDLGCGDGRWIITASQIYNCRSIGCDLDKERLAIAKTEIQKNAKLEQLIQLKHVDVIEFITSSSHILKTINVLIVYLFREAMQSLCHIFQQNSIHNLQSSTTTNARNNNNILQIVCVGFSLPNWIPFHQEQIGGIQVYIYHATRDTRVN